MIVCAYEKKRDFYFYFQALNVHLRQPLHELGFKSTWFHDFETASKSLRFGNVYTKPFSRENPSRDGISEPCAMC